MDDKKGAAPKIESREKIKSTCKDLETIAAKILILFHDKKITPLDAKRVLEKCNRLVDLNSEIVIEDNQIKVDFLSHLLE